LLHAHQRHLYHPTLVELLLFLFPAQDLQLHQQQQILPTPYYPPSTKAIAGKIAKFILDMKKVNDRVKLERQLRIIGVSHVPPLMCFLGHVFAFEEGKDFIDEEVKDRLQSYFESGFVKPLEGFNVTISENHLGEKITELVFSNEKHKLPIEFLNELTLAYEKELF